MTKDELKQYRALKLELEDIDIEIRNGTIEDSVQGSMKNHPYIKGIRHIEGVTAGSYGLLYRKSDIKAQIRAIEQFVDSIEDLRVKYAVRRYYIDSVDEDGNKATWETIADKLNDGSTGDSIKKTVSRYLKKYL